MKLRRVESNLDVISLRRLYDDAEAQVRILQSLGTTEENYGTFLAPIIMKLVPLEVLWNLNRFLMIIECEINARENAIPLWNKRGFVRMFFLLRNHCQQLVYLLDKNLNRSVFPVRNLTGLTNFKQSLIQVHEKSF